jgi:DNA polymerase III subunit epsilon
MRAHEAILTVLDFETTGTVRGIPEEPWQIGMVEMKEGKVTGTCYETWLRIAPGRSFNPYAPGRHTELRDTLAVAPEVASLWPTWRPWLEDRPLVAHNVGTEKKFLRRAAPMHTLGPWIDTLKLARHIRPDLEGHSLSEVCEAMGVIPRLNEFCPGRAWHDALYDAFACALVLEHGLAQPGWETVTLEALSKGL